MAEKKPEEIDCSKPEQWVPPCGFINPDGNFDFQAKQRDALLQRMVMSVNDPAAVKAFQRYNRWVFDQAIQIADVWEWNLVQDPTLNPLVKQPVSPYGLSTLRQEVKSADQEMYENLREEGAFFVFFSRSDCSFCHRMLPILGMLQKASKMEVHNAAIDEQCLGQYENTEFCLTAPYTLDPAAYLQVRTVPDLFLYIPSNKSWIRIATGIVTEDKIQSRIRLFTNAVKAAAENGIQNAQNFTPSVDFRKESNALLKRGVGEGVSPDLLKNASNDGAGVFQ